MDEIIELLRTFSQTGNLVRVFDAEQALQPFSDRVIPALIESLKDPDADLRIFALKILENFDGDTEPALPAMINALMIPTASSESVPSNLWRHSAQRRLMPFPSWKSGSEATTSSVMYRQWGTF